MKKFFVLTMLILGIFMFSSCNNKPSVVGLWYCPDDTYNDFVCFFEDGTRIGILDGKVYDDYDYKVSGNTLVLLDEYGEELITCGIITLTKDELHIFGENEENGRYELHAKRVH